MRDAALAVFRGRRAENGDFIRSAIGVGSETAIARAVPTYGYAYQYRPSPGSEATARLRERRPLLVSIERVLDARKISCRTRPRHVIACCWRPSPYCK